MRWYEYEMVCDGLNMRWFEYEMVYESMSMRAYERDGIGWLILLLSRHGRPVCEPGGAGWWRPHRPAVSHCQHLSSWKAVSSEHRLALSLSPTRHRYTSSDIFPGGQPTPTHVTTTTTTTIQYRKESEYKC